MGDVSFTHVLNPFPGRPGSEHQTASEITLRTLRVAKARADAARVRVDVRAVILHGDEPAVTPPCTETVYLERTVQDVADLKPRRPLPLIGDVLAAGASDVRTTHVVFSNMDIAVQPHFYESLHEIATQRLPPGSSFTVPRLNIEAALADAPLEAMYAADGPLGQGYDCFVVPRDVIGRLDLGLSCIGAPYFDLLLMMELDLLSPSGFQHLSRERLTFHLGNDIGWAAMIDYVEHNLHEGLAAIERIRARQPVPPGSAFDRGEQRYFRHNATAVSALMRRVRRLPGVSALVLKTKRALGRQF